MFNKDKFSNILNNINSTYTTMTDFGKKASLDRTYISKYINKRLENPPTPKILEKIAIASNGITSYEELMQICGYSEETIENIVYNIYQQLKNLSLTIYKKNDKNFYEVESSVETFQKYSNDLIQSLKQKDSLPISLIKYYHENHFLDDYNYVCSFLFLFESFLRCLEKENYIVITNYKYTNWFDDEALFDKLLHVEDLKNVQLLSNSSNYYNINLSLKKDCLAYIKKFATCLNLAYLSDFDNNALTDLFKQKMNTKSNNKKEIVIDSLGLSEIGFDINNYTPPTDTQKEQIKAMIEIILKDNKKDTHKHNK